MSFSSLIASPAAPHIVVNAAVAEAALKGLSADHKSLPPWLFYDAEGSRLFERITHLREYYLTRLERSIFVDHGDEIVEAAAGEERLSVLELGAGTASKTVVLLQSLMRRQRDVLYMPVDVSQAALEAARRNVHAVLPAIRVRPICSEYTNTAPLDLPQEGRRLALYIGSSIGNFDAGEAMDVLRWLRDQLEPADTLLLGTDMVKDVAPLLAAYNDKSGVTAEFNKNILVRLNRELGADFSLDTFGHKAIWNAAASRMEIYLTSARPQWVRVAALDRSFRFERGEAIHTENSYKFTPEAVEEMLLKSGFVLERSWYDAKKWFGVHLARVIDDESLLEEDTGEAAA